MEMIGRLHFLPEKGDGIFITTPKYRFANSNQTTACARRLRAVETEEHGMRLLRRWK
jgi:hypothetical protein